MAQSGTTEFVPCGPLCPTWEVKDVLSKLGELVGERRTCQSVEFANDARNEMGELPASPQLSGEERKALGRAGVCGIYVVRGQCDSDRYDPDSHTIVQQPAEGEA